MYFQFPFCLHLPSVGVRVGHLRHLGGHINHPPLELCREQPEEGQQEDDHSQSLGERQAS